MKGKYTQPNEGLLQNMKDVLKEMGLDKDVLIEDTDDGLTLISKGTPASRRSFWTCAFVPEFGLTLR